MFFGIFPNISKWNVSNVINMNNIFGICKSLKSLPDISKWNTENVTNMEFLFNHCISFYLIYQYGKLIIY